MSEYFQSPSPAIQDYWRGIILFGRNVASYKFALAKSLLELEPQSGQTVKLEDIAPTYAKHISEHLKHADKQGTFRTSKFLEACRAFNNDTINQERLIEITVQLGFNNVIDAFHVVGQDEIVKRFFIDTRRSSSSITITDEFSELMSNLQSDNLMYEV